MKHFTEKILCWLLVVCTVVALWPSVAASAAETADFTEHFGYTQMKTDGQRAAYVKMCKAVVEMDTSGVVLEGVTKEEVSAIAMLLPYDLPQAFYFRGPHYINMKTDGTIYFVPMFVLNTDGDIAETDDEVAEVKRQKAALDAKVKQIISDVPAEVDTDYEKSVYVHDLIAGMVEYKFTRHDQTAYGALIEGQCVCAGYASAYMLLMRELGVKTWMIYGVANNGRETEAHAWNVAWINGDCVYTDPTWGDLDLYTQYRYLNISGAEMAKDHQWAKMYDSVLYKCDHDNYKHEMACKKVQAIEVNATECEIAEVGGTWQIKGRVIPNDADDKTVVFSSDKKTVATVDQTGLITAVGEGTATITIRSADGGALTTVTVTVRKPECKHDLLLEPLVEATCQNEGVKAHYKCKKCSRLFLDKSAHLAVDPERLVIDAKQHQAGAFLSDDKTHWRVCSDCNIALPECEPHQFDKNEVCTVCGYHSDEYEEHPTSPFLPSPVDPNETRVPPDPTTPLPTLTPVAPTDPTTSHKDGNQPTHAVGVRAIVGVVIVLCATVFAVVLVHSRKKRAQKS